MKSKNLLLSTAAFTLFSCPLLADDIVAVYDLEGAISETGAGASGLMALADQSRPMTHFDLMRSMKAALADDEVKAVVVEVDGAGLGFSQLQDVHRQLTALKEAGKSVWLYTENLSNGVAYLASAADKVVLMPEGNVDFNGMYSESLYFKGMLDKFGLKADVIHIGDFKSAGETFYRTGPSEPAKLQTKVLLDDIYGQILDAVSEGRGISKEEVQGLVDQGFISPEMAKEKGLVDELMYRTDLVAKLRETYADAEFDRDYGMPNLDGPEIDGIFDLVKVMFNSSKQEESSEPYVAVIALDGAITDASIAPVRAEILKTLKDDRAKALVLRVNSPGGSASASDVLWEATDEWSQSGRPFIVSMGDVAASGGYYVSAGADQIFAEPGTITGSIGVVGMKFVAAGAMEKMGVTVHREKRGEHSGAMSMTQAFTEAETELIVASMEDVYGTFKKRITDGRGDRLVKPIAELGGGRVYSGALALEQGLVDQLGGINEAVAAAAKAANLNEGEFEVTLRPRPLSAIEAIFAAPEEEDGEIIRMSSAKPDLAATLRASMIQESFLDLASPQQKVAIRRFLEQVKSFQENKVQLIGEVPTLNL